MVVGDTLAAKRLAVSVLALSEEMEKLDMNGNEQSRFFRKKQRGRSNAVGSQGEFLKKSLEQCSAFDYSGSDGEVERFSRPLRKRSSSLN